MTTFARLQKTVRPPAPQPQTPAQPSLLAFPKAFVAGFWQIWNLRTRSEVLLHILYCFFQGRLSKPAAVGRILFTSSMSWLKTGPWFSPYLNGAATFHLTCWRSRGLWGGLKRHACPRAAATTCPHNFRKLEEWSFSFLGLHQPFQAQGKARRGRDTQRSSIQIRPSAPGHELVNCR